MTPSVEIFAVFAYEVDDGYALEIRLAHDIPHDIFERVLDDIVKRAGSLSDPVIIE